VLAAFVAGCADLGKPAQSGMTVADYYEACGMGEPWLETWGPMEIGECSAKPDEYVLFERGRVSTVMSTDDFATELNQFCQASGVKSCPSNWSQQLHKRTAIKGQQRERLIEQFNQELTSALAAANAAYSAGRQTSQSAYPSQNYYNQNNGVGGYCSLIRQEQKGMNKICVYNCTGSIHAVTQSSVSLCPLSVTR
jgi:hypothetical protein